MIVFTKGKIKSKGNASKIKLTLSGKKNASNKQNNPNSFDGNVLLTY